MNVAHIFDANCGNWGEKLVGESTKRLLSRRIDIGDYKIFAQPTMPSDMVYNYQIFNNSIDEINTYDLALFGGGGSINFLRYNPYINQVKTNKIVYAVGWNRLGLSYKEPLDLKHVPILQNVKDSSLFFSVRADGSMENLKEFGFKSNESWDAALWVSKLFNVNNSIFESPYVIVSIGFDFTNGRFGTNNIDTITVGLNIKSVVDYILETTNYNVVVMHHRPDDHNADIYIYNDKYSDRITFISWEQMMISNIEYSLSIYKNAEYIFTNRGHSIYCGYSYGVPCIVMVDQLKLKMFMDKIGMNEYSSIMNPSFDVDLKNIINSTDMNYLRKKITEKTDIMWRDTLFDLEMIGENID